MPNEVNLEEPPYDPYAEPEVFASTTPEETRRSKESERLSETRLLEEEGIGESEIRSRRKEEERELLGLRREALRLGKISLFEKMVTEGSSLWELRELVDEWGSIAGEKKELILEEEGLRLEKRRERLTKARQEREAKIPSGYEKAKYVGTEVGKGASRAQKVLLLGGAPKFVRKELYVPTGMQKLTSPSTGMRKLTTPGVASGKAAPMSPAGAAHGVDLSKLREAGRLGGMPSPTGDISPLRKTFTLERLAEISVPSGWSKGMAMAYREVELNHDVDTKSHVLSELMDSGILKPEAVKAIKALKDLGYVREVKGSFADEPELVVTGKGRER